ncbi:Uncharacterised protein [Mycobacteroides abscessus subsp. abscessus]|nr:Uncharacterised protein [Mycobacteroides abscessus subsp. abscessus]SHX89243.1 Uncharacterised protein [Mycobacteroides abscessus subsp. abscessus]SHZ27671.1 Uncharacterised protein [Mycobacteroides abscessus subsp. abscessus]SID24504.1 Uncharacterised protein [Mycobacteroides abscessus subsp. abscessus]SID46737.1 Uncharacterised protein [Mycobacteroides abscessus subsp. abscessus]
MTDPAIEARAKAIARIGDGLASVSLGYAAECGAREMAKSVQELIAEARTWKPYSTRDIGDAYCAGTVEDFLDELSKRVYPSEELGL